MNKDIGFEGERLNKQNWYALDSVSMGNKSQDYTGDGDTSLS